MSDTITIHPGFTPRVRAHAPHAGIEGGRLDIRPVGTACLHALTVTGGSLAIAAIGGLLAANLVCTVFVEALRFVVG